METYTEHTVSLRLCRIDSDQQDKALKQLASRFPTEHHVRYNYIYNTLATQTRNWRESVKLMNTILDIDY